MSRDLVIAQLSRWLPLLVSLAVNVYLVGFKMGNIEARLLSIEEATVLHSADKIVHMPLDRKYELFVPRAEYANQVRTRDTEVAEMKAAVRGVSDKADRIIEILMEFQRSKPNG